MDEISTVHNFFQSHQVHLSFAWLESCVNWCKEENLPSNYTLKDLQLSVFEQWLLLDLRDLEVPCLPPSLADKQKYTLSGNYSVQVMQIVDISKPKYWQLQRIRKNLQKNDEQEAESSKRILLLTLTDGVQQVEAIEFRPIPSLNLNLTPGIKIRLMGPMMIRRGRIFLENHNVKVIGGEVDSLIVSNAAENILAKQLNLPINPTPNIIPESMLRANKDMFNEAGDNSNRTEIQNINLKSNSNASPSVVATKTEQNQSASTCMGNINEIDDLEEQKINEEIEMIMEAEMEFENTRVQPESASKTLDLFDDMGIDDNDLKSIEIPENLITQTKIPIVTKSAIPSSQLQNISAHLHKTAEEAETQCSPQRNLKPWTIERLVKNMPNISNGKFKLKAKFRKIVEKLTMVDDKLHLVVEVEDDSGDMIVKVHSDIVAELMGMSHSDFIDLKTGILNDNEDARNQVIEVLTTLRGNLIKLDQIMEVHVNAKEKYPVIVKLF